MRLPLLIAAVLVLSSCGKNNQTATSQNADEGMTAESIVSNDVTAIDAVTGDAANMAADVDMNYGNLDQGDGASSNSGAAPKPADRKPAARHAAPGTNSNSTAPGTTNTVGNSE